MTTYDGSITIGVKADSKEFDKDLKNIDNKIKQFEKEAFNPDDISGLKINGKPYEELGEEIEKVTDKQKKLNQAQEDWNHRVEKMGKAMAPQTDYNQFMATYETASESQARLKEETRQTKEEARRLKNEEKAQQRIIRENERAERAKRKEIERGEKALKRSATNSIRQIGRLALGIFGLRSAYMAVRQASSTLAQYDEQYSANLQYIRFVLAQAIAPVLKYIVNLVGTLLSYLNYILNSWYGINLFANASAKKFAQMNKSMGGTAQSAKEIKKQLAGFDEITLLGDSKVGTFGGGLTPNLDLGDVNKNVPKWVEWIAKNGKLVRKALLGISSAIAGLKLASVAKNLGLIGDNLILIKRSWDWYNYLWCTRVNKRINTIYS